MAWQTTLLGLLTLGAIARITRLVTEDKITQPIRDWVAEKAADTWYAADEANPTVMTHAVEAPRPWRYLDKLLTCPWCSGFWISALAVLAFMRCWLGTWPDSAAAVFGYVAASFAASWVTAIAHEWLDSPPPVRQVQLLPAHVTVRKDAP